MPAHSNLLMIHHYKKLFLAAAALGCTHLAAAERNPALDILVKKGIITVEERAQALESAAVSKLAAGPKEVGWFEKLKIDGYTQFRFTESLNDEAKKLGALPADRSVSTNEGFLLRRGRFKITGDVGNRVSLYSQLDFAGNTGATTLSLQARDLYADIGLDDALEHRIRAGLSKVPYGWVNMQSSQNRLTMERAEGINSAVEGERDLGLYYMYASTESRALFKSLVKDGLKGSGDYGVFTIGGFNGQGPNRSDQNGEPHLLARLSYPWKTASGQIFEAGISGYTGKYVVTKSTSTVATNNPTGGPEFDDRRACATFIMYPQPFGIEAEWNVGQGPQLNDARTAITLNDLQGGYVLINYRYTSGQGDFFPFIRWNYYDGARKFSTNAYKMVVNEIDVGCEWQLNANLELQIQYTLCAERNKYTAPSNTAGNLGSYANIKDSRRLAIQLQFNY